MTHTPDFFQQLAALFQDMDRAWNETARQYDFECTGCEDNCCLSLFFHHTHIEKAYLVHGFNGLDTAEKNEILARARAYCDETFDLDRDTDASSKKIPCPLLVDGRCRLYLYRPMICRMHGLPHEIQRPGFPAVTGPGCHAGRFDEKNGRPFDRTPFYRQMAEIEMGFRIQTNQSGKIKQTIAQILMEISP
ncbi:MAG: hypothetical protein V6Z89_22485 [Desulfobacter sp.]